MLMAWIQNRLLKQGLFLIALFSFSSCSHKEVFFEYHSMKNADWNREDEAVFKVIIDNQSVSYDISIDIRNDNDYPFSNIWLFVDLKTPGGSIRTDTLSADLADVYGKWYGKGLCLHSLSIPYETGFHFPYPGTYTFVIRQGMRENPLKGISDVGLKVSKKVD
jgi:gliding motility-associated lipoprotein GldH